jgi:hypothetical protein
MLMLHHGHSSPTLQAKKLGVLGSLDLMGFSAKPKMKSQLTQCGLENRKLQQTSGRFTGLLMVQEPISELVYYFSPFL